MARLFQLAICVLVNLLFLSTGFAAFSTDFATSDECTFCHDSSSTALIDSRGNDLSIASDWGSSMMAQSFKDPLFRAKMESEILRNPHLKNVIEDKCLTCHSPMARTQSIRDGVESYSLHKAENSALAGDGVSCTLCHQIQDRELGSSGSFSGNYTITGDRKIFGPYKEVFPNPMLHHTNYLPILGEQVHKAELCATCHTLFTPYVDEKGNIAGQFPEQTPYLEWLNSSYANRNNQTCQDCHMPRLDEPVKITNRPPWFSVKQTPFWKHHFTGGNIFMLNMMKENRQTLGIPSPVTDFEQTIARTKTRLGHQAANITVEQIQQQGDMLLVDVLVKNKSGHKFPTGFPSRRVWIHLAVTDDSERTLFESGQVTALNQIVGLDTPYEPHHTVINSPDQVQIYQAVMGDVSGKRTHTLLNAARYLKDNRLLPKGYRQDGPMTEFTKPYGRVVDDNNFNQQDSQQNTGCDRITYAVALKDVHYPLTIKAQLLYQSSSQNFIHNLLEDQSPAIARFKTLYADKNNIPFVVDSTTNQWRK